jgi:hypothetical protein
METPLAGGVNGGIDAAVEALSSFCRALDQPLDAFAQNLGGARPSLCFSTLNIGGAPSDCRAFGTKRQARPDLGLYRFGKTGDDNGIDRIGLPFVLRQRRVKVEFTSKAN